VRNCLLVSLAGAGFLLIQFEPLRAAVTFTPVSACTRAGDTITCTGDLSAGVDVFNSAPDTVSTLIVSSSTPISVSSLAGVSFQSDGVIFITSKAVITSQTASGIYAEGTSGDVTVRQTGNITTLSAMDAGIYLKSTVPAGSTAGNLTVTQIGDITAAQGGAIAATSMSTGNNGTGGDVTVTQTGNIASQGVGIWANSVAGLSNGTGGDVTVTQTGNIASQDYGIEAFSAGGDNGAAGQVTVTQSGNIRTQTDNAFGITAYSHILPNNQGTAGDVTVTQTGNITTLGEDAYGIQAYARTFDGSAGNVTVTQKGNVTTQADGAYGIQAYSSLEHGTAGNVTVTQTGNITTWGDDAYGIKALSESRDGAAAKVIVTQIGDITTTGANSFAINAASINGLVGSGVTVTQTGNITTQGGNSYGIQASSTVADFSQATSGPGHVTVTQTGNITAQGGDGIYAWSEVGAGTAGNVTVTQTGNITTPLSNASGIQAFSKAEDQAGLVTLTQTGNITALQGGGIWASSSATGANGTANDVTVRQTGNIVSLIDGIYAESFGGSNGTAGHVTVTQSGTITAGGHGIFASIYGQTGTGSIVVNLSDSTIQGGGSTNAGVHLEGLTSTSGTLNSYGVTTISALSGTAVSTTDGNDTINNFGVLTTVGTVDLGAGTNFINNMAGATYNSGTAINLGAGNLFTNAGTLSPGGSDVIATTSITGNFVQTSSGRLLTDINLATGTGDLTTVSGTASLAGNVRVRTTDFALGQQQVTIFSAAGGTANNGLGLISSPALHASLLFPNADDVALAAHIDFVPSGMGLNHNQTDLAKYLNRAAEAGSPGLTPLLLALVNGPSDMTEYRFALNQLLPAPFLNSETTSMLSSAEFSNDLFSCNVAGAGNAFIRQDECVWVRPKSRRFDFEGTSKNIAFDDRAAGLSAGAQFRFAPQWFATVALGYEHGNTETSAGAKSDSDHYQAGLGLKYQAGSWLFAGAVSGGVAQYEIMRTIAFPEFASVVAQSDPDVRFVTGQVRAAYLSDFGSWYAKPLVDMRVTYLDRDAVTETGGGPANLWVSGSSDTSYSISPAVEFGTEYAVGAGTAMKPFVKTGITYVGDTHSSLTAGFVGAAPGVTGFEIDFNMDDLYADLEAGVQIFRHDGSSLSFGYKELISDDARQNSVFAKGTMKF
jgi:hypothetical protein